MDGRYETVYDPSFIEALQTAEMEGDLETFLTDQGADVLLVRVYTALQSAAQTHPERTLHDIDDTASIFTRFSIEGSLNARTGQSRPWAHFP